MAQCPICEYDLRKEPEKQADYARDIFDCCRCGYYAVSWPVINYLKRIAEDKNTAMALSHYMRKYSNKDKPFELIRSDFSGVKDLKLPDPFEQARNLVQFMGENYLPGELLFLHDKSHGGIVGALSEGGLKYIIDELCQDKVLENIGEMDFISETRQMERVTLGYKLTFKGWEMFNNIKRGNVQSTRAFMAMPFGNAELNKIVDEHFRPAVKATGFSLFRLDDEPRAGLIDDQLILQIKNCRFLIADVTHENLNVSWEAGYAEGLDKPVIYTCEEEKIGKSHFDISHRQTIKWNKGDIQPFIKNLKAAIRVTIPEATHENEDED